MKQTIELQQEHLAARHCLPLTDPRKIIHNIYVGGGDVMATDGKIAIIIKHNKEDMLPVVIPRQLLDINDAFGEMLIVWSDGDTNEVAMSNGDFSVAAKTMDADKYPSREIRKFLLEHKDDKDVDSFSLGIDGLMKILKTLKEISCGPRDLVTFHHSPNTDTVLVRTRSTVKHSAIILKDRSMDDD